MSPRFASPSPRQRINAIRSLPDQAWIAGYVSFLAACDMNSAFSEYVLYEPILRILTAQGYSVECEYECPGIEQPKRGEKKRLNSMQQKPQAPLQWRSNG